jgi:siroheme synthase (precorrin-2 oxidase/ferrochelatase)
MTTQSFWLASHDSPRPEFPKARSGGQYDVVVIGGGITGVTAAFLLKQSGKRVCLVEKHTIGSGETGHTSAHLAYATDARFHVLVNKFGNDVTELVWKGGLAAIAMIEKLVDDLNIDCGFKRVPGYLVGDFRKKTKDEFFIERDYVNASTQLSIFDILPARFRVMVQMSLSTPKWLKLFRTRIQTILPWFASMG